MLKLHFMTYKIVHNDRNGITRDILPLLSLDILISKSCRLAKSAEMKCYFHLGMNNIIQSVEKTFNMTAVILLVICLRIVSLYWHMKVLFFCGMPVKKCSQSHLRMFIDTIFFMHTADEFSTTLLAHTRHVSS